MVFPTKGHRRWLETNFCYHVVLPDLGRWGFQALSSIVCPCWHVLLQQDQINEILGLFYGGSPSVVQVLADIIMRPSPSNITTQYHVLELLAFCVTAHTHRMKKFVMQCNMIGKVVALLQPHTPIHLQCGMSSLKPK